MRNERVGADPCVRPAHSSFLIPSASGACYNQGMGQHAHESDTEALERRNRELAILKTIAEALNREVDLTRALNTALAHATELFNLHTGWIWLLDEETGEPYL